MGKHSKGLAISLALGATFVVLGVLEIIAQWVDDQWLNYLSTNGNLMLGLVLMLAGAVLLAAAKGFREGVDGEAYMIVGCALALFVGLVALLTLAADASEAYLFGNEDFTEWAPLDDFTLAIPMMVPSLIALWYGLKTFRSEASQAITEVGE